jgi:hypothetical protein
VKIFLTIFGIASLYGAARFALGIWFPKHRGYWGGPFTGRPSKTDPDAMRLGVLSHLGCAILLSGFALGCFGSLLSGASPNSPGVDVLRRICTAPILIGFFLVMLGWTLDSRAHDAARRVPSPSGQRQLTAEELLQRWLPVIVGSLLLLTVAWALIFLK